MISFPARRARPRRSTSWLGVIALLGLATACSGSGGGAPPSTPPPSSPPVSSGPVFRAGVFDPASVFEDRCAIVRTGVDIEGRRFPDRPGSALEEKFWLRSWTRETYLWNDEVVDQDPNLFADRIAYFNVLKTTAITPSGRPRDEFHFTIPTDEYLRQINSAPSADYGVSLAAFSTTPPRDFRVQYTEPNSPASAVVGGLVNLKRGARILRVDGIDLVNASSAADVDALNAGLFPEAAGETHTFEILDPGASTSRVITLTSVNLAPRAVNRTAVISAAGGDVGYILFNTFSPFAAEREIAEAIAAMRTAGVSDLVLDLRYNGGGLLAIASQLSYMVAGPSRTSGRIFEALRFNALSGSRNPVTGQPNNPTPFFTTGLGFSLPDGSPLQTLNLPRVFILTTADTCSASESVINALRGINLEVILIGGVTCGKPFGFFPTDNCGVTYFTIQFQGVNDQNFGDYADGFSPINSANAFSVKTPGCAVADDFSRELGDPAEGLLAAALQFRSFGSCPPASATAVGKSAVEAPFDAPARVGREPGVFESNRDLRMPPGR